MLKFDIREFCKRFGLQQAPAWYAIKYIEREGHWSMAEDADIPTRVKIDIDRTALYSTDLPDPEMPHVLEALMRLYTGIFSYPVSIDEEAVAAKSGVTVPALRQLLYGLSINHVIRYIPSDHATIISLAHGRLMPGNVKLSPERYRLLKSTFHERTQTMTDYVEEEDECRSQFLLRYFGEDNSSLCGKCDICRAGAAKPKDLRERLQEWISRRDGKYTLMEIRSSFGTAEDSYLEVLRDMIDKGEVPEYGK